MGKLDGQVMVNASSATAAAGGMSSSPGKRRELSAEAMALASEHVPTSYPPVVVAGFARLIELSVVAAIGLAVYAIYVLPGNNFGWHYPLAIFGVAALSVMAFQTAGIYRMQSFRSRSGQYARLITAWLMVFLLLSTVIFLGKWQHEFSRVWMVSFFSIGLGALTGFRMVLFGI